METPIENYPHNTLALSSSAFSPGESIPVIYTCDGENISPPLSIVGVPENTESLVLVVEDPDVPKSIREDGMWDHWIVFDIAPDTTAVAEDAVPSGAVLGTTTSNSLEYSGPCPPDREHRYFFRLLALDTTLSLPEGILKDDLLKKARSHVIDSAELMGRYER